MGNKTPGNDYINANKTPGIDDINGNKTPGIDDINGNKTACGLTACDPDVSGPFRCGPSHPQL